MWPFNWAQVPYPDCDAVFCYDILCEIKTLFFCKCDPRNCMECIVLLFISSGKHYLEYLLRNFTTLKRFTPAFPVAAEYLALQTGLASFSDSIIHASGFKFQGQPSLLVIMDLCVIIVF